ncbi:MAG: response regulator receiver protein [Actinobacteria bacterium]|nr:response regulator receiver protein [Actinomycetota bacterium]
MDKNRSLKGARIALIEDDRLLRSSLEIFLRVRGAFVEAFECAEDAILAVSLGGFDAVISDFLLEGENGVYILLRARQASKTVGTILITAYGISTISEDARQAGVDILIFKPFSTIDLENALHQAIGKGMTGSRSVPEAG